MTTDTRGAPTTSAPDRAPLPRARRHAMLTKGLCTHRHSPPQGSHCAHAYDDLNFAFAHADCRIIGADDKIIKINKLHAVAMSPFFSVAFLNQGFVEAERQTVKLPLFNAALIVDALETTCWIMNERIDDREPDLSRLTLDCAYTLLHVGIFLELQKLVEEMATFVSKNTPMQNLVYDYQFFKTMEPLVAGALRERILFDFNEIVDNDTYLDLQPEEFEDFFTDPRANIQATSSSRVLSRYSQKVKYLSHVAPKSTRSRFQVAADDAEGAVAINACNPQARVPYEAIVVHGGWATDGPTSLVEIFNYQKNVWETPDDNRFVDGPRAYHGLYSTKHGLLNVGGFNGNHYYRSCVIAERGSTSWKPVCTTAEPRCYVSVGHVSSDVVVVAGGNTGRSRLKSVEAYDFSKNQWLPVAPMNIVRSDANAATFENLNKIYVVGGFDGRSCHDTVEYYDPHANSWQFVQKRMATRRSGVGAVVVSNRLLVIGGFDSQNRLSCVESFDPREGRFHRLAPMLQSRSNFGSIVFRGEPWVVGGYNHGMTIWDAERYDERADQWHEVPRMAINRSALAIATIKDVDWIAKILPKTQPQSTFIADDNSHRFS